MLQKFLCSALLAGALIATATPVRADDGPDKNTRTVTGCLTRGADNNQWVLTESGGATMRLNNQMDISKHLNHMVKVTVDHRMDGANKPATDRNDQTHVHTVKKIEHVSNTCTNR